MTCNWIAVESPLFLQFKLPHQMVTRRAKEYRDRGFPIPCYRMYLRPASVSSQHESLMDLESTGNEVYYVAPLFHTRARLDLCFRNRRVWRESFRVRPGAIGPLPDGRPHHVSYRDPSRWIFMSDEVHREGEGVTVEDFTTTMIRRLRAPNVPPRAGDSLLNLDRELRHLVRERRLTRPEWQDIDIDAFEADLKPMERLAYLTQRLFDCQLFIVSEKEQ